MARSSNIFSDYVDKDKTDLSRVVTIYMDVDEKNTKNWKKIYFSQKRRVSNQNEIIKNLIEYCYKGKQKFVPAIQFMIFYPLIVLKLFLVLVLKWNQII